VHTIMTVHDAASLMMVLASSIHAWVEACKFTRRRPALQHI
jgi:hypothetical protein